MKVSIKFNVKFAKLMQIERNILTKLILCLNQIDISIIISRKIINKISNDFYEKSKKFIKFLIKKV